MCCNKQLFCFAFAGVRAGVEQGTEMKSAVHAAGEAAQTLFGRTCSLSAAQGRAKALGSQDLGDCRELKG